MQHVSKRRVGQVILALLAVALILPLSALQPDPENGRSPGAEAAKLKVIAPTLAVRGVPFSFEVRAAESASAEPVVVEIRSAADSRLLAEGSIDSTLVSGTIRVPAFSARKR